jgi:hypothetical protein
VHEFDDLLGTLFQPDVLGTDAFLLDQPLQIGDRLVAMGFDPVKGCLQLRMYWAHRDVSSVR